jgi:hypothetical protein
MHLYQPRALESRQFKQITAPAKPERVFYRVSVHAQPKQKRAGSLENPKLSPNVDEAG